MKTVRVHSYKTTVRWTGNAGSGTSSYTAYKRDHQIATKGKPSIPGSSDPLFRGDRSRYNPEELLLAAVSACHMLWYLHLCADAGIVVTDYEDQVSGEMAEMDDGGGHFVEVILKPTVTVLQATDFQHCNELHEAAHRLCYIANSVNFPVRCFPQTVFSREN